MKRALACMMCVAVLAGTASALSVGPGMYVYTSVGYKSGSNWQGAYLYRATINSHWDNTTTAVNFDTINPSGILSDATAYGKTLDRIEVWDPRAKGGQGNLALGIPTVTMTSITGEYAPYDVVKIDASNSANNKTFSVANGNLLVMPKKGAYTAGSTAKMTQFVRTKANWGGVANNNVGIAAASVGSGGDSFFNYRYDTNINGRCDNVSTEYTQSSFAMSSTQTDMEYGPDDAVYWSRSYGGGIPDANGLYASIYRYTNTGGTIAATTFATVGKAGNPMGKNNTGNGGLGTAVGGTANRPIVYVAALDNVLVGGVPSYTMSIFALVDGDADGQALWTDPNDKIVQLWRSGDAVLGKGITQSYVYDIEYYKDDNNVQWLLFSGGSANSQSLLSLYALQLVDNGLVATGGKLIGAGLAGAWFEIDANPVAGTSVPEPAALALLGTGALGLLGHIRRRRMT